MNIESLADPRLRTTTVTASFSKMDLLDRRSSHEIQEMVCSAIATRIVDKIWSSIGPAIEKALKEVEF